jgi:biopolymer transport protein ExbB
MVLAPMKQLKVNRSALKKGFFCLLVPMMFPAKHLCAQISGYTYGKTITIQASQVAATQTNFPVLVNITTDNNLRTTANGGHVQNANGYDIIFTLNDCSTILSHQIEKYDATNGQLVAWVKIPTLSSAVNTTIYMFYGKSSVSTNPSTTAVWDSHYMGVYHFNSSVNDGSSNSRNLTDNSTANLTSSKIGEGRRLANNPFVASNSGSLKYLTLPSPIFSTVTNFSFEGWVYLETVATNWERIFDFGRNTTFNMFLTPSTGTGTTAPTYIKRFAITINGNGSEQQISSSSIAGTGAWHHYVVTINASTNTGTLYYDGAVDQTNTSMTYRPSSLGTDNSNYFGRSQYSADEGLYGNFDEFRISDTVRSATWITTSYRNQNSPSTFYSISSETAGSVLCTVLPVKLTSFETVAEQNGSVTITWVTEQEANNEKYVVERSGNGTNWEAVKTVAAAGNNSSHRYMVQDLNPIQPVCYYRLKQLAVDNAITYSSINTVKWNAFDNNGISISPNPAQRTIKIAFAENISQEARIEITNNMGLKIPVSKIVNGNNMQINLPVLANGVYFLNVYNKGNKYSSKLLIVQ